MQLKCKATQHSKTLVPRANTLHTIAAAQHDLAFLEDPARSKDPWTLTAHALFNLKEFQFLR